MLTIRYIFIFKELVQSFNIWAFFSCEEALKHKNKNYNLNILEINIFL